MPAVLAQTQGFPSAYRFEAPVAAQQNSPGSCACVDPLPVPTAQMVAVKAECCSKTPGPSVHTSQGSRPGPAPSYRSEAWVGECSPASPDLTSLD